MTEEKSRTDVSSDEVIRKYFDMVYRLSLSLTRNISYAEDVTQDVFLRFIQHKDIFETDEHIKAWLIRVTINCSKSIFMASWFRKTVPLEEELSFSTPEKSEVYFAVQDLPSKYRAVIHLHYYEEMSVKEIADCLNEKESTVKSQLRRGRELLKSKLKGGYDFV
ncbi:MAG: sigma-70 family RNA polymerase sigma factor [Clostridia bacterium]|nr:sigma-70 family RNA polymerase sigma factor [Clostridia bacterium]